MAQSVVYADLKFATGPPCTIPDEDDSPYENVQPGPVPAAPSPGGNPDTATASGESLAQGGHQVMAGGPRGVACGFLSLAEHSPQRWHIPRGLLAASLILLLLLLVAIVALGTCYWQVTRSLQDASRDHAAEQSRLSQELSAREQSLEQTELELAWARAELQRAWHDGNSSQLELERLTAELGHVRDVLGKTEKEMQEVQGKLNNSESTVSSLRACVNTDCCPSGWVLYRSKCLFISVKKKRWWDSLDDCRDKSAQLLVE
ncbi:CD72 protein, partial [Xiphorhynchus elegans]|nr:CD72 protein [Xiphorhynchus elegans]